MALTALPWGAHIELLNMSGLTVPTYQGTSVWAPGTVAVLPMFPTKPPPVMLQRRAGRQSGPLCQSNSSGETFSRRRRVRPAVATRAPLPVLSLPRGRQGGKNSWRDFAHALQSPDDRCCGQPGRRRRAVWLFACVSRGPREGGGSSHLVHSSRGIARRVVVVFERSAGSAYCVACLFDPPGTVGKCFVGRSVGGAL